MLNKKLFLILAITASTLTCAMQDITPKFCVFEAHKNTTKEQVVADMQKAYDSNTPFSVLEIEKTLFLRLKDFPENIIKKLKPHAWFNEETLYCEKPINMTLAEKDSHKK